MAQTYVPIQTITLATTSATIDFTNIPQTYTDLLLVISSRTTNVSDYPTVTNISFNGSTSNFSGVYLENASGTVGAFTDQPRMVALSPGANTTSNTFGNSQCYIANYTSSNNKAFNAEAVGENNGTRSYMELISNLWSNSAAITSISLTPATASFAANSTATLYGIGGARATGGTITADSNYTYHTFTSTGTFTALENIKGAQVLCIAGGGGGNQGAGGGGGAGGVNYVIGQPLTAGNSYSVIVGSGGAKNVSGSNSQMGSLITSTGGGGGGGNPGLNGGSGGGGGNTYSGGTGISGQGNNGGSGSSTVYPNDAGGGGGGAGAVGTNGSSSGAGGAGGVGTTTYSAWGYATSTGQLSGSVYYYAGGGGGYGRNTSSIGGLGGGGGSNNSSGGTAGTANTGGGGGAFQDAGGSSTGGSGLVIIRYPN